MSEKSFYITQPLKGILAKNSFDPNHKFAFVLNSVADLGEGPGVPGLPLILGKKRRND